MNKSLLLFDIDGTILKFKHNLAKQLILEFLQDFLNIRIDESHIPDFHGMTDLQIINDILNNLGYEFAEMEEMLPIIWSQMHSAFEMHLNKENIEILPGVMELINLLSNDSNFALGLLTGNFYENAYQKLKSVNLDHFFKFGAFGNDAMDRNSLPQIAISRANHYYKNIIFDNKSTLIIGDTTKDEECARVNNIKCICVSTGAHDYNSFLELRPNALFENFKDTTLVIKTIYKLLYDDEENNNSN